MHEKSRNIPKNYFEIPKNPEKKFSNEIFFFARNQFKVVFQGLVFFHPSHPDVALLFFVSPRSTKNGENSRKIPKIGDIMVEVEVLGYGLDYSNPNEIEDSVPLR